MALPELLSSCFSPVACSSEDTKNVVIFLACLKFMVTRRPDDCVEGIWEDILRITVKYSLSFSEDVLFQLYKSEWSYNKLIHPPELCTLFDPSKTHQMKTWLDKALSIRANALILILGWNCFAC